VFHKIIMWEFADDDFDPEYWARIDASTEEAVRVQTPDELFNELPEADALLIKLGHVVDRDVIGRAPALRYIGMFGSDLSRIDTEEAARRNIAVRNVAGYSTEAVAEFAFGVTLDHFRHLTAVRRQGEAGDYSTDAFLGKQILDKTWGVIGLGRIGGRIADLALAFGAEVVYWSRTRKPDYETRGISYCELDDLLARSDVISLNVPLTTETEGIIDPTRVESMKAGALLLDLAPIELLDFDSVYARTKDGTLTLALNHSYELEAEQIALLESCDNCILFPPISSYWFHSSGYDPATLVH
jgi:phosphoglycerate dehydrogenase-like enzyme